QQQAGIALSAAQAFINEPFTGTLVPQGNATFPNKPTHQKKRCDLMWPPCCAGAGSGHASGTWLTTRLHKAG
ncbi:MAG: hypothetical protein ACKPB8_09240, partial [Alphaproteobacteria bacterium]